MSVSRLNFYASFPFASGVNPLFYLQVWREGNNCDKHDQQLVDELNQYGLKSELTTAAASDKSRIESGQTCFGGGYYSLSFGCTKQEFKSALAKLNGMTIQEVAAHWKKSEEKIDSFYFYLKQLEPKKTQENRL